MTTGPDGRFDFTATAGEYRLGCRHEAYAAFNGEPLTVGDGGLSDLVVELSQGATVIGRITGLEAEDLSRLVVVARGPYEQREGPQVFGQLYGSVNFAGELRIPGLLAGEWVVRAELLNPTRSAAERIEIEPGDAEMRVDLHFEHGYSVTGSVLRRGQPLAGATVILRCANEFRGETFTDKSGRFAVEHVPEGGCTVRSADPESGLAATQELEVAFDAEVVVELGL